MSDIAASGAYYIAAAADKIYANPGTITGSIGVIISYVNAEKLLGKVGLEFVTVKSGQFKDVGSFARPTTPEDKKLLQAMIQDVVGQFTDDVVKGRLDKLAVAAGIKAKSEIIKKELVREYVAVKIADGRIITGKEALALGLVDELGSIDDAIEGTAKMIGLKGRPWVLTAKKKQGLSGWINSKVEDLGFKALKNEVGFSVKFLLR